jgi:hypothetical protein
LTRLVGQNPAQRDPVAVHGLHLLESITNYA